MKMASSKEHPEPRITSLAEEGHDLPPPGTTNYSPLATPVTTLTTPLLTTENVEPELNIMAESDYLLGTPIHSELVIGIVSSVGTERDRVLTSLRTRLNGFGYNYHEIRVSSLTDSDEHAGAEDEYTRIKFFMRKGDEIRSTSKNDGILAFGAAKKIAEIRRTSPENGGRTAYIVNSLKRPEEVFVLRKIYQQGFYLLGIHADEDRRLAHLRDDKMIEHNKAKELILIDEDEKISHGQRTRDTYHLSDFFLSLGNNEDPIKNSIQRFLELIFGNPHLHPTFDEYAMFMAFSSSARSGDLSRQVGAIIAKNNQIIASGANECPAANGGQYWAGADSSGKVMDIPEGKDYTRGVDSNKAEQLKIISEIKSSCEASTLISKDALSEIEAILRSSRIADLTEFGRVVHAEMDALLSCARAGISCDQGVMYCTTFPCHNCAKHIVAAGLGKVVYVEPYPKSKALDLHEDSIVLQKNLYGEPCKDKVTIQPFTGVGPRRFLDFFSMSLGAGGRLKRKEGKDGKAVEWSKDNSHPRVALVQSSYKDLEQSAISIFEQTTSRPS